jgi:hypothetical protein
MRQQRYHGPLKRYFPLAVGALLAWWRWRPFRVEVAGASMAPTLRSGDFLVAVRSRGIHRGSLVVVEHPDRTGYEMVKRVGAVPGDRVEGRLLGPNEYWVTGDNPDGSSDSRTFGRFPPTPSAGEWSSATGRPPPCPGSGRGCLRGPDRAPHYP